jgi:hydroxyacylglutathione hydrolase
MEIVPGIHRVDGIRGVNSYLVSSGEQWFLVDTGLPWSAKRILRLVERLGKKPADIKYLLLTHADIDHVGCASELKKKTGAEIAIHAGDAPVLAGRERFKTINNGWKFIVGVLMALMPFHPLEPDIILDNASQIDGWRVIHTPGHTKGSICIYQPGKSIFVGDALRTDSEGRPRPVSAKMSLDDAQAKKSLSLIADLDFEVLFPGHGAPMMGNASRRIREMVARYK